jgi:MFS family permease
VAGDRTSDRHLPRTVWALGLTSLFMDMSSELIHGLLPLFLVLNLGASAAVLGVIEGIAEATAQITRVFSGWLSDVSRRRKLLAVLGYGLAAATKPLFPLATSVGTVLFARFADRVGKGIRGAPRDALVADVTPPEKRGAAFGLRQSLDTLGAVVGPAAAILLMLAFNDDIRTVLWFAVPPAVIAVAILLVFVREPKAAPKGEQVPVKLKEVAELGRPYWFVIGAGAIFTLARFSEAFLVLRAQEAGLALALAPAVIAVMSLVFAASAYPAGRIQDKAGARPLLLAGLATLMLADLALGFGGSLGVIFSGIALWGLHMGLTQGVLSALVAASAPERLRGTAFGIFGLVTGLFSLVASILAGALWTGIGPDATFATGAALAFAAFVAFLVLGRVMRSS